MLDIQHRPLGKPLAEPALGRQATDQRCQARRRAQLSMQSVPTPWIRASLLAGAAALAAGCTWTSGGSSSSMLADYRSEAATQAKPLDVPPDLTQLARDSRYQVQGGVVSAAAAGAGAPSAGAAPVAGGAATPTVAVASQGDVRIERQGQQRWLLVKQSPEQVWPQVRSFWEKNGFTLAVDNAAAGLMETNWAENRSKLPNDYLRNLLGKVFSGLWDSGERDLYRTRLERVESGTEIYISHRGLQDTTSGPNRDSPSWRGRANDPQLEAQMLARLMLTLSPAATAAGVAPAGTATTAGAVSQATAAVQASPDGASSRARLLTADAAATQLEVDESFDRAWRRVGLALDRGGFTVEDRDRAGGLYYVRYIDPKTAGQEEPGFFSRLFGTGNRESFAPRRYRITLKAQANGKTLLAVQNSSGGADVSENAKRIAAQLVNELR